jgi:hypothetical protein
MKGEWTWFIVAMILFWGGGLLGWVRGVSDGRDECPPPEITVVRLPAITGCEATYGPVPVPRIGYEAWGVVCLEGTDVHQQDP